MCGSIKYPYLPHGRSLEIPRGKGVWTAKIYKGKYEAYLEIPGGREGWNQNTFRGGGMDIFWNHTILNTLNTRTWLFVVVIVVVDYTDLTRQNLQEVF